MRNRGKGTRSQGRLLSALLLAFVACTGSAQEIQLFPVTNAWKYDATTIDYGTAWKDVGFDDTAWAGPSPAVIYNDNNPAVPAPTNTVVPLTYLGRRIIAYYYRTTFTFPTNPAKAILIASNLVDDGAIFWLNGQYAGNLRMTNVAVPRTNLATGVPPGPQGDATIWEPLVLTNHLVEGTNVLAVEVHQNSATSPDTLFGVRLQALLTYVTITDESQITNRTVLQGRPTTFTVTADALPAPDYQWFHDDVPIPGATGPTYAIARTRLEDAGAYYCQISNVSGTTNTRPATLVIEPDVEPPTLVYALANAALTSIVVSYSEPMDTLTALDPFNYTLYAMDGSPVPTEVLRSLSLVNETNVVLTVDPLPAGAYYQIVVIGASDTQSNPISDNSAIPISATKVEGDLQQWRFNHSGASPDSDWTSPLYDDSASPPWYSSAATFFAKSGAPVMVVPLRTQLALTNPPSATNFVITYYFRARFTSAGFVGRLQLRYLVDDGAVFYLNGTEIHRVRMPAAPTTIGYPTYAASEVTDALLRVEGPVDVPAGSLVDGENVLTVEVHQAVTGTPDMYFSAELIATGTSAPASRVRALPAQSGRTFMVSWGPETGGGSPPAGYDLWAATNSGIAGLWLANTTATSAPFQGVPGATYSFYSVWRDAAGPVEAAPATPDAETTVATGGPTLSPVPNQTASAGQMLFLTNDVQGTATGAYRFRLAPGAPRGVCIDPATGVLRWLPACWQGGTTNPITVWVTDSGAPNLSDATGFLVIVDDCVAPALGCIPLEAGAQGDVPLQVSCTTPITNLSLAVDFLAGRLSGFAFTSTLPALCQATVTPIGDSRCLVELQTCAGQSLIATQLLGALQVSAATNQVSAFVPLAISEVSAQTLDGRTLTPLGVAQNGRVAVVAEAPLLDAWLGPARQPLINLYGKTGTNYAIESAWTLSTPVPWQPEQEVILTNIVQTVLPLGTTNAVQWYRAQQR